ncbi:MAG: hypothetical protein P1V51_07965 [Deltaproteobacteria bacterium]|nr:hypothetical protein [Deltaproteobacteria bacterium]
MSARRQTGPLRALAVLGVALLALAGTLLLALEATRPAEAEPPPAGPAWAGLFPGYPGAQPLVPVADGLRVGGLSARVGYHLAPDAPGEVQRFYADAFRAEGLAVQVSEGEAQVLGVTALDGARHHQRSVTILPGGGGSVVFLGLTPTDVAPEPLPPLRLPVPRDARLVSDSAARDGQRTTRTVTMVSQLSPAEASEQVAQRMRAAGFSGIEAPPAGETLILRGRAPWGEEVTYTFTGGAEQPTAVVAISRAPEPAEVRP